MVKIDEELKNMEDVLRRLKVEYQVFFNHKRKKPPEDLKLRLEKISRQLSDRSDMSHAQRFRFNTLLTRYYTYKSLWRRTLQKQENSKEGPASEASSPSAAAKKKPADEKIRVSLSNPQAEGDKVKSLYDALLHYKKANLEEIPFSYNQFATYIASQTQHIRINKGCSHVTFTVSLEGDAVRFTATAEKH
jgi:hypothetical protein